MEIQYTVASVVDQTTSAQVEFQGETVNAEIPVLRVELYPGDEQNSTITLRFTGSDIPLAREAFTLGRVLTWAA